MGLTNISSQDVYCRGLIELNCFRTVVGWRFGERLVSCDEPSVFEETIRSMNEAHIVSLEVRRDEILDEFRYERGSGLQVAEAV